MAERVAAGVDVGGTYTKIAAVTRSGRVLSFDQVPTRSEEGPEPFVSRVCGVLEIWRSRGLRLAGVGLGLAGEVDAKKGCLRVEINLRGGWAGFSFKKAMGARLGVPVAADNDANAAVWGGYVTELRRRPRHVVGVTLGTGVGGGIIVDGKLVRGATGSAGELGHQVVVMGGEPCHCGARGCVEAYAGSYALTGRARRLLKADPRSGRLLRRACPDLRKLEPRHLSLAAQRGDTVARRVWSEAGEALAQGLANVVLALNPEVILVLGGVSRAGRWILDPVRRVFGRQAFQTPFRRARVRLAAKEHAGSVGAALLAWEEISRTR